MGPLQWSEGVLEQQEGALQQQVAGAGYRRVVVQVAEDLGRGLIQRLDEERFGMVVVGRGREY